MEVQLKLMLNIKEYKNLFFPKKKNKILKNSKFWKNVIFSDIFLNLIWKEK